MSILISRHIMEEIVVDLKNSKEDVMIISAFCKVSLLKYFDEYIPDSILDKNIIVRMRPDDILSGATDLELYTYCEENKWNLFFRMDLHAKTYIFDHDRGIVGSANATRSGLSVGGTGNYEMATAFTLDENDLREIKYMMNGSARMTHEIYMLMQQTILNVNKNDEGKKVTWPEEIISLFKYDFSILFSEDFPQCNNPNEASDEDMEFLNLYEEESVREAMMHSKCYQWLLQLLQKNDNHEMYFGRITEELHNVLLDDPKPYRKDVKILLANLLSWIQECSITEIVIDRPNHSQRVRLLDEKYNYSKEKENAKEKIEK